MVVHEAVIERTAERSLKFDVQRSRRPMPPAKGGMPLGALVRLPAQLQRCPGDSACGCDHGQQQTVRAGQTAPAIVQSVLRSGRSEALQPATRALFENRFGHDFSDVRVHVGSEAANSARAVDARAYTVGRDIVFGDGEYSPHSASGQRLLAHELTHVVQQSARPDSLQQLRIGEPGSPAEHEAEVAAEKPSMLDAGFLQRQPKPTAPTSPPPSCTPRTGTTEYGCYCGAGRSCATFDCTPADALDACCRQHDIDYGTCGFTDRYRPGRPCFATTRAADARLCQCVNALRGRFTGAAESYRLNVIRIFC